MYWIHQELLLDPATLESRARVSGGGVGVEGRGGGGGSLGGWSKPPKTPSCRSSVSRRPCRPRTGETRKPRTAFSLTSRAGPPDISTRHHATAYFRRVQVNRLDPVLPALQQVESTHVGNPAHTNRKTTTMPNIPGGSPRGCPFAARHRTPADSYKPDLYRAKALGARGMRADMKPSYPAHTHKTSLPTP